MSTTNQIKSIAAALNKEVMAAKKEHEKLAKELSTLTGKVAATEALVTSKTRILRDLENILRSDEANTERRGPGRPRKNESATEGNEKTSRKRTKDEVTVAPSHIADGRKAVAEGLRPPIKDAIAKVMGERTMTIDEIFEGLRANNWLPNSSEPRQYISYLLSTTKERFERVPSAGRGVYRGKVQATATEVAPRAPTVRKRVKAETSSAEVRSTDQILADSGLLDSPVFG